MAGLLGQESAGVGADAGPAPSTVAAAAAAAGDFDATAPADLLPLAGLALLVGLMLAPFVRWIRQRIPLQDTGPARAAFELRDVAALMLVFLGLQVVAGVIVTALDLNVDSFLVALPLTVGIQGAACAFVLALAWRRKGLAALGLRRHGAAESVAFGAVSYFGSGPFLFALLAVTPYILQEWFGMPHEPQDVAVMIAGAKGLERLFVPLFAVILIPLMEELLFRGFMQGALEARLGVAPALVLTSLAFAALHGASALIPIFGLSLILGLVMLRTRRLVACWFVHALHNGLTTGLLFFAPDTVIGS
ncbi:MAG: type II CAAX endopeptidase family protein [Planctomycetota bacterium]